MKRSEVNAIMREADAFIRQHHFYLPPFSYWSPEEWKNKGPEAAEIVRNQMGWDITDFGKGNYAEYGLFLFTIRNGHPDNLKTRQGRTYAEKLLICEVNQITPLHFHWTKVEDIINRGGGNLAIELYNSTADDKLADTDITVSLDGVERTMKAGSVVMLKPGESITLPTRLYHKFWAEGAKTLVGEVSVVNDDLTDNCFYEPIGRFATVEEDEPPLYLLIGDYAKYYRYP
jgi:D-lyxose ketol-isomerase